MDIAVGRADDAETLIFINYRCTDSASAAAFLHAELSDRFGAESVFLDYESIPLGHDFVPILLDRVRRCAVLVVAIGNGWLDGKVGDRPIDDPDDWVRREILEALDNEIPVVPVLLGTATLTADRLPAELATLATRQYFEVRDRHQRLDIRNLGDHLTRQIPRLRARRPVPGGESPYQGLDPFRAEDQDRFFGRAELCGEMVVRLEETGALVVVGVSGAGKSSVLRAGLLPALGDNDHFDDHAVVLTPGHHPVQRLAHELARAYEMPGDRADTLLRDLAKTEPELRLLDEATDAHPDRRLPVVVDQFEELFTQCRVEQERTQFIAVISSMIDNLADRIAVVIAVRADFYSHCARFPALARLLNRQHQIVVGAMTEPELRQAIEQPALHKGVGLEPGLVEVLLRDSGTDAGSLPLLSTVLYEMWGSRRDGLLTLDGYRAAGTIKGAIETAAEGAYARMGRQERRVAREVFLRLTSLGEEVGDDRMPDTRRRVPTGELTRHPRDGEAIERTLQHLARARLITLGDGAVTFTHDAIIAGWVRLREWLAEDRASRLLHRRLTEAARDWNDRGRKAGDLHRGDKLRLVMRWSRQHHASLNTLETEFLEASVAGRRRRRRGAGVVTVAVLAVIALLAQLYFTAKRDERDAAQNSLSRKLASASETMFDRQPLQSMLLSVEAYRAAPTGEARNALLDQVMRRPGMDAFITGLGNFSDWSDFSEDRRLVAVKDDADVVVWDLRERREITRIKAESDDQLEDEITDIAVSPDGTTLATVGFDAKINVYRVADGKRIRSLIDPDEDDTSEPVNFLLHADYSPDGRFLAVGGAAGRVVVWDTTSGARAAVLDDLVEMGPEAEIQALAFSPDGSTLVAGTGFATVRWKMSNKAFQLQTIPTDMVAFSLDGSLLAIANAVQESGRGEWEVTLLDARSGRPLFAMARHSESITALALSPDARTLVTADTTNTIRVWNVSRERQHRYLEMELSGHNAEVAKLAFTPDGGELISLSEEGTAIRWDLSRIALKHHTNAVAAAAYSRDGKLLATGSNDGSIALWDVRSRSVKAVLHAPDNRAIENLAFSPQGDVLASAHLNAPVQLWNVREHRRTGELATNLPIISNLAFSPDGRTLVGVSLDDPRLPIWDLGKRKRSQNSRAMNAWADSSTSAPTEST